MDKDAFICPAMLSADYMLMFTQYINLVHIGEKGSNTTQLHLYLYAFLARLFSNPFLHLLTLLTFFSKFIGFCWIFVHISMRTIHFAWYIQQKFYLPILNFFQKVHSRLPRKLFSEHFIASQFFFNSIFRNRNASPISLRPSISPRSESWNKIDLRFRCISVCGAKSW